MKKTHLQSILFFIGPVLAVLFGMYTVYAMGIPTDVFFPNAVATILGIPLVYVLAPRWSDRRPNLVLQLSFISILLLLLCFFFPGPSEVHRWIVLGSININVSMIVLPIVLFCLHQLLHEKKILHGVVLFAAVATILGFQPDAGQASAFAIAALVIFFRNKMNSKIRAAAVLISIVTVGLAWNRVDLLEPVEYVEDIFYLMASLGPVGFIGMIGISLLLFVPFVFMSLKRIETVRTLSITFIVYLSTALVITEFGHYPVPVMGAGASPVVGWFLMLSFVFRAA